VHARTHTQSVSLKVLVNTVHHAISGLACVQPSYVNIQVSADDWSKYQANKA